MNNLESNKLTPKEQAKNHENLLKKLEKVYFRQQNE